MTFPSPEVARAVGDVKEYLDWMNYSGIRDFEESWKRCPDGVSMFKVLLLINPAFKNLHWVASMAAWRVARIEKMDLDEKLLDYLIQKGLALVEGFENYSGEPALAHAIALSRDLNKDKDPNSKSSATMSVGFACSKSVRTCQLALEGAVHTERFRITEGPDYNPTINYPTSEAMSQAEDIRELFPLPLTSRTQYPNRYTRPWVI